MHCVRRRRRRRWREKNKFPVRGGRKKAAAAAGEEGREATICLRCWGSQGPTATRVNYVWASATMFNVLLQRPVLKSVNVDVKRLKNRPLVS
jgi:hypothetical protein